MPTLYRAAHAGIRLIQTELSQLANVLIATLVKFEAGRHSPYERTLRDIQSALENVGVFHLEVNETGSGIRIRGKR